MKDSWKGYALATLTAFLLGGGASSLYNSSALADLREEHKEDVEKLESEQAMDLNIMLEMAQGIARLEEQVKYIKEKLDER